ncbi:monomeric sarcosine oxidase [Planomicrobium stackebrandtii]|uniref:Monomeric sarcosine oxidase n=1 Tax=Planomicrobium stackebrandtii TaxID=253160 RepID=A0ABU0GWR3_9BACL|nr:N-methyl-L-tryptophan oxidase [Planomicrobium stackebrandtii]MDQ0429216.1 monomeric sarcosine oxidase [Planomicrobium stackebrandtii]
MTEQAVFDVAIIGAGTMGMAAGAFLAQQKVKTLLIDAFDPPHSHGSHHGDTRLIRHAYGEGRQYVTLVKRAQQLWEELEQQTGYKIFEKTGVIGLGPKDSPFLEETIASAQKHDLSLELLTGREINARWPGFSVPDHFTGCFEADSGVIYSENAIQAYKETALAHGAQLVPNTAVQHIDLSDEKGVKITTELTTFYAKKIIVTAGAWAAKLLPDLELPIQPTRKAVAWFEAPSELYDAANFPAFFVEDQHKKFYGFPILNGGGIKIGRSDGGQPIDPDLQTQNFGLYETDENDLREGLEHYLPQANGKLKQGKTCLYTLSSDNDFIVDVHPEDSRVLFACGFSGHGFKFGSVMGEVLSQLAITGESKLDISIFALSRFGLQPQSPNLENKYPKKV